MDYNIRDYYDQRRYQLRSVNSTDDEENAKIKRRAKIGAAIGAGIGAIGGARMGGFKGAVAGAALGGALGGGAPAAYKMGKNSQEANPYDKVGHTGLGGAALGGIAGGMLKGKQGAAAGALAGYAIGHAYKMGRNAINARRRNMDKERRGQKF